MCIRDRQLINYYKKNKKIQIGDNFFIQRVRETEKLNIDLNTLEDTLVAFLKDEVEKTGFKKVVLGLSGGIDSALVLSLIHIWTRRLFQEI